MTSAGARGRARRLARGARASSIVCALAVAAALGFARTASAGGDKYTLRFGTLAPKHSYSGKALGVWAKVLEKKSFGHVELQVLWNGVAGRDATTLAKIRSGELDGATLGLGALSSLYRDIYVVELPGVTAHWMDAETVQRVIRPDLENALGRAGIKFVGWGEWGAVRLLTRGYTASRPRDLARRRVSKPLFDEDPVVEELFDEVGATIDGRAHTGVIGPLVARAPSSSSRAAPAPSVLHGEQLLGRMNSGIVEPQADTTLVPALGIPPDLSSFDHVDDQVLWFGTTGAFVLAQRLGASLPADLAKLVDSTARDASRNLVKYGTAGRDAAYRQLLSPMKVVRHTPDQTAEWQALFRKVVEQLAQTTIDKAVVNRVLSARHLPPVP